MDFCPGLPAVSGLFRWPFVRDSHVMLIFIYLQRLRKYFQCSLIGSFPQGSQVHAEQYHSHRCNFRGRGGPDPPLFWFGRTDPHFISTPSQKLFCLVPPLFRTKVTPLITAVYVYVHVNGYASIFFGFVISMDLQHKSEHKKDKDALMEDENAAKQQTRLENLSFSKEIFFADGSALARKCKCKNKLDGCIVWNAHNAIFGSKGSAICAQAVSFLHSTRFSVTWLNSRWWLVACDWVMSALSAVSSTRVGRRRKFGEVSCTDCTAHGNDFELIPTVKWKLEIA